MIGWLHYKENGAASVNQFIAYAGIGTVGWTWSKQDRYANIEMKQTAADQRTPLMTAQAGGFYGLEHMYAYGVILQNGIQELQTTEARG